MPSSSIEDIKNRLDILEVVSGYLKLQKTGINYRANCPFHAEKTPSFFVSPTRQMWHCFGCGKGGDIFSFVKEIEGVEFGDALRLLAQKAGVELKPSRGSWLPAKEMQSERTRLHEICELATNFFEKQLGESKMGKEAKQYLLHRGLNESSIKSWRLGYSPDTWSGLLDFLVNRGYKKTEVEKAGLAIRNSEGGFYDRFRGRLIFPVTDLNSQVIGFGGRVVPVPEVAITKAGTIQAAGNAGIGTAKYINTPATLLYDKGRTLYGLDKGKVAIRQQDSCVLVEGYTDAIMSLQGGVGNVVAVSGTALTPWHLKILRRYTENLLISFDMDKAGDKATKRGIDLALSQGFNLKVVLLPESKDPAELVLRSPGEWPQAVESAKSILEFYFDTTLRKFDPRTVSGQKEIAKVLLPVVKKIPNKIEQTFWLARLAKELGAKEEDLLEEMAKIKSEEDVLGLEPEEIIQQPVKSRPELLEERLATFVIKSPAKAKEVPLEDEDFLSPWCRHLLVVFRKAESADEAFQKLEAEVLERANYLALKAEALQELSEKEQDLDFKDCLREIRNIEIKRRLELLSQDLRKAEGEQDTARVSFLLEEFRQLVQKLKPN